MRSVLVSAVLAVAILGGSAPAVAQDRDRAERAAAEYQARCERDPDSLFDCRCVARAMRDDPSIISEVKRIRDQESFRRASPEAQAVVMQCRRRR